MIDLSGAFYCLHFRVLDDNRLLECLVERNVDVLVDRRRDHKAAKFAVIRGKVRAATAERNPQRAACNDHVSRSSTLSDNGLESKMPVSAAAPPQVSGFMGRLPE